MSFVPQPFTPDPNYAPYPASTPNYELTVERRFPRGWDAFILYEEQPSSDPDQVPMIVMGVYSSEELAQRKKQECEDWHREQTGDEIVLRLIPQRINQDHWLTTDGPITYAVYPHTNK